MNLLIDPKAEPIGHRSPYKPIEVSGRKVARPESPTPVIVGCDFGQQSVSAVRVWSTRTILPSMKWWMIRFKDTA